MVGGYARWPTLRLRGRSGDRVAPRGPRFGEWPICSVHYVGFGSYRCQWPEESERLLSVRSGLWRSASAVTGLADRLWFGSGH